MSQNCVVTFTWMISAHGLVLRYSTDTSKFEKDPERSLATYSPDDKTLAQYVPTFDSNYPIEKKDFWDNTNYISLSHSEWYAVSSPGNGWQAQQLMFRDIFGNSKYSQDTIEEHILFNETIIHKHLGFTWSKFENVVPWEKAFFGYNNEDEKNRLTRTYDKIERGGRAYNFNKVWDPQVGVYPIGGGFCRLMLINVTNGTEPGRNYYYGDNYIGPNYGFKVPTYQLFLSEIGKKCWENSQKVFQTEQHKLGDLGNDYKLRMCIYDGTCNHYKKWIMPDVQNKTKEEFKKMADEALRKKASDAMPKMSGQKVGGSVQYGGTNVAQEIAYLERIMKEQSEIMNEPVNDPYNVGLNILFDLKELVENENEGSDKTVTKEEI